MIQDVYQKGSYLELRIAPYAFPLRTAENNAKHPRQPAELEGQLITVRFELDGATINALRVELVLDHASYLDATARGLFGLDPAGPKQIIGAEDFDAELPIHLLLSGDLDHIGRGRFEGLDIAGDEGDREEVFAGIVWDGPSNAFHDFETWRASTVQQLPRDAEEPIGFDVPAP